MYRLYNPNARSGSHHYTLSLKEHNALIQAGWKAEGTAFFAISDYDFARNDNEEIHGFDSDQNELKGRVGLYDDWYEFDETGVLQTGWIEENGQPDRYSMPDGRQLLGFAQVENDRYFFDLETGSMHRNTLEQDENGSEFWFDENGRAVSGRVFVYPKVGQASAEGIVWNTFGWDENPVRHTLLRRKQELETYRENPEVLVQWNETCSNTLIQDAIAEYEIVQSALKNRSTYPFLRFTIRTAANTFTPPIPRKSQARSSRAGKMRACAFCSRSLRIYPCIVCIRARMASITIRAVQTSGRRSFRWAGKMKTSPFIPLKSISSPCCGSTIPTRKPARIISHSIEGKKSGWWNLAERRKRQLERAQSVFVCEGSRRSVFHYRL